ncbi:MAG: CheY-like chemotaxis protein [Candidatus Azotimanducaceae bacterium]|jgi:CheY-like chemotaxis protein
MAENAETPSLLLMTETDSGVRQVAKDVGANGWVQKPIVPEQKLAGVSRVLIKQVLP